MTQTIDRTLMDEAFGAYLEWREACVAVQDAYGSWARAPAADAVLAYLDYVIALDREEAASNAYVTPTLLATATSERGAAAAVRRVVRATR